MLFLVWNMYREVRKDVDALKSQNGKQETDIATLQANNHAHSLNSERLASAIVRLEEKIDQLITNRRSTDRPIGK